MTRPLPAYIGRIMVAEPVGRFDRRRSRSLRRFDAEHMRRGRFLQNRILILVQEVEVIGIAVVGRSLRHCNLRLAVVRIIDGAPVSVMVPYIGIYFPIAVIDPAAGGARSQIYLLYRRKESH